MMNKLWSSWQGSAPAASTDSNRPTASNSTSAPTTNSSSTTNQPPTTGGGESSQPATLTQPINPILDGGALIRISVNDELCLMVRSHDIYLFLFHLDPLLHWMNTYEISHQYQLLEYYYNSSDHTQLQNAYVFPNLPYMVILGNTATLTPNQNIRPKHNDSTRRIARVYDYFAGTQILKYKYSRNILNINSVGPIFLTILENKICLQFIKVLPNTDPIYSALSTDNVQAPTNTSNEYKLLYTADNPFGLCATHDVIAYASANEHLSDFAQHIPSSIVSIDAIPYQFTRPYQLISDVLPKHSFIVFPAPPPPPPADDSVAMGVTTTQHNPMDTFSGHVAIYDLHDTQMLKKIAVCRGEIRALKLSPDGRLLAVASTKGTLIRVFSTATGNVLHVFRRGHKSQEITSMVFSFNNELLAVSSRGSNVIHIFKLIDEPFYDEFVNTVVTPERVVNDVTNADILDQDDVDDEEYYIDSIVLSEQDIEELGDQQQQQQNVQLGMPITAGGSDVPTPTSTTAPSSWTSYFNWNSFTAAAQSTSQYASTLMNTGMAAMNAAISYMEPPRHYGYALHDCNAAQITDMRLYCVYAPTFALEQQREIYRAQEAARTTTTTTARTTTNITNTQHVIPGATTRFQNPDSLLHQTSVQQGSLSCCGYFLIVTATDGSINVYRGGYGQMRLIKEDSFELAAQQHFAQKKMMLPLNSSVPTQDLTNSFTVGSLPPPPVVAPSVTPGTTTPTEQPSPSSRQASSQTSSGAPTAMIESVFGGVGGTIVGAGPGVVAGDALSDLTHSPREQFGSHFSQDIDKISHDVGHSLPGNPPSFTDDSSLDSAPRSQLSVAGRTVFSAASSHYDSSHNRDVYHLNASTHHRNHHHHLDTPPTVTIATPAMKPLDFSNEFPPLTNIASGTASDSHLHPEIASRSSQQPASQHQRPMLIGSASPELSAIPPHSALPPLTFKTTITTSTAATSTRATSSNVPSGESNGFVVSSRGASQNLSPIPSEPASAHNSDSSLIGSTRQPQTIMGTMKSSNKAAAAAAAATSPAQVSSPPASTSHNTSPSTEADFSHLHQPQHLSFVSVSPHESSSSCVTESQGNKPDLNIEEEVDTYPLQMETTVSASEHKPVVVRADDTTHVPEVVNYAHSSEDANQPANKSFSQSTNGTKIDQSPTTAPEDTQSVPKSSSPVQNNNQDNAALTEAVAEVAAAAATQSSSSSDADESLLSSDAATSDSRTSPSATDSIYGTTGSNPSEHRSVQSAAHIPSRPSKPTAPDVDTTASQHSGPVMTSSTDIFDLRAAAPVGQKDNTADQQQVIVVETGANPDDGNKSSASQRKPDMSLPPTPISDLSAAVSTSRPSNQHTSYPPSSNESSPIQTRSYAASVSSIMCTPPLAPERVEDCDDPNNKMAFDFEDHLKRNNNNMAHILLDDSNNDDYDEEKDRDSHHQVDSTPDSVTFEPSEGSSSSSVPQSQHSGKTHGSQGSANAKKRKKKRR